MPARIVSQGKREEEAKENKGYPRDSTSNISPIVYYYCFAENIFFATCDKLCDLHNIFYDELSGFFYHPGFSSNVIF